MYKQFYGELFHMAIFKTCDTLFVNICVVL
jgi:hypothetical protein